MCLSSCSFSCVVLVIWCRETVIPGNIIIRQRGKTYHPGDAVKCGRDYTLYALKEGWVKFDYDRVKRKQVVSVSELNPHLPNMRKQRVENIAKATDMSFEDAQKLVNLALASEAELKAATM
jgi:ribosomal protein L27